MLAPSPMSKNITNGYIYLIVYNHFLLELHINFSSCLLWLIFSKNPHQLFEVADNGRP
jgi:hypothetical protein